MGAMFFAGQTGSKYGRSQGPTQWKGFGPRVGFAWNPTSKLVIRSGFGIAYAPSALQAAGTSGASGMQGFSINNYINSTFDNGLTIRRTLSDPFAGGFTLPTGTSAGTSTDIGNGIGDSYFSSYRNSYSMQWNFNIQHELPGQMTAEVGYLGNHGLFLVDGDPGLNFAQLPSSYAALGNQLFNQVANPFSGIILNSSGPLNQQTIQQRYLLRPYPQYNGVQSFRKPTATSMYHAFTVRIIKRFSNGLTFLVSFTGGKTMDNSAAAVTYLGSVSSTREDQYNRRLEWSISPQDISHSLITSFVYDLPFGKGKRFAHSAPRVGNLLVSGWQANGIVTWQSGTPIVLSGAQNSMDAIFAFGQRPDNNGHSAVIGNPSINGWFNTSVFPSRRYSLSEPPAVRCPMCATPVLPPRTCRFSRTTSSAGRTTTTSSSDARCSTRSITHCLARRTPEFPMGTSVRSTALAGPPAKYNSRSSSSFRPPNRPPSGEAGTAGLPVHIS
jgi:hypothetical protein